MVNFMKIVGRAKAAVEAAGGPEALKEKAEELKGVAKGSGSLADKAKAAAEVVTSDPAKTETPAETDPAKADPPAEKPVEKSPADGA